MVYVTLALDWSGFDKSYESFVRVNYKLEDALTELEHGEIVFESEDGKTLNEMLGESVPRPECVRVDEDMEKYGKFHKLKYYFKVGHQEEHIDNIYTDQHYNHTITGEFVNYNDDNIYQGSVICLYPVVMIYDGIVNLSKKSVSKPNQTIFVTVSLFWGDGCTLCLFRRTNERLEDAIMRLEHGEMVFQAEDGKEFWDMFGEPVSPPECVIMTENIQKYSKFHSLQYWFKPPQSEWIGNIDTTQQYDSEVKDDHIYYKDDKVYQGSVICLHPIITIYDSIYHI